MARVTIEDCLTQVDNRFELVLLAGMRAHELANGADAYVEPQGDKPAVVALREIAAGKIDKASLMARARQDDYMQMLTK